MFQSPVWGYLSLNKHTATKIQSGGTWDYDDDVRFVLDQHAESELDLCSARSLTQQSRGRHACHSTWTHFSYSKPISICSYSLVLCATRDATNTCTTRDATNTCTNFSSTRTHTQDLLHDHFTDHLILRILSTIYICTSDWTLPGCTSCENSGWKTNVIWHTNKPLYLQLLKQMICYCWM